MQLHIYVTPNAKSNSIQADGEDMFGNIVYKCRVTAPPHGGAANNALMVYLSELLNVPKTSISLLRGAKSRHKIIDIAQQDLLLPF